MIDGSLGPAHHRAVLSKSALLAKVEEAAASRAEIARVLHLAPARITELYKGDRDLTFDEARILMRHYKIEEEPGGLDLEQLAAEHNIAFVEEVDLALGMGGGTFAEFAESKGMVPFSTEWLRGLHSGSLANLRVVRGRGDSMEPTIHNGDFVLIDMAENRVFDQDLIWAVFYGDLGMIKRVRRQPQGTFLLMSDNPTIPAFEAADGEMHILGRVIWIGRRM